MDENGKKYKVLVTRHVLSSCMDFLREQGYEVIHTNDISEEHICSIVGDVDAILSRELKTTRRILDAAPKLKIIARFGVGTDMIDMSYATERGVWVGVTPLASSRSVAEHTMTLLLACAKLIVPTANQVKQDNWIYRNTVMGCDLEGKTIGLVGLGKIGRLVVKMARGFDMRVVAYDAYLPASEAPDGVALLPTLKALLEQSDFVSLHCPATAETEGLIDRTAIAQMKPGAILVNSSRGALVDEQALYEALVSGHLRAAGLDVSQTEPPTPDNPLLKLDNLILTPHMAAVTDEAMYRMGMHAALCIDDVLRGKPPRWPANNPEINRPDKPAKKEVMK